uniref:Glycoside-hydrolase family GH114 TIM-barrel domain-containing protein n=1 Tax=Helicotheca tamesis TaxID=374047 RepID=A0A6U0HTL9_9STRA|mmetsp:Transcript_8609/g.11886  ORF Transcript_8609/g.11886 Transcript_8609/m.11886 type:complete len:391 (+) Transcript_8609:149-1321(+)
MSAANDYDYYPEFSWDTLPLYIHIRKRIAFEDEDLEYLSKFPLITLEKTTGMRTYGCTCAGSIKAAEQIKERNPNAKVLYYRNCLINYTFYSFDKELDEHDDWFLKDKDTGENIKVLAGDYKLYDLSQPEVQEWWINKATKVVCDNSSIDGLFVDANIKVLDPVYLTRHANVSESKKTQVQNGWNEMMDTIQGILKEHKKLHLANIIRTRLGDSGISSLNYFDGSYIENIELPGAAPTQGNRAADNLEKGIAAVQQAAQSGKIIAMTLGLGESAEEADYDDMRNDAEADFTKLKTRIDFSIGLFLIIAEKYSYLNMHDGYDVNVDRTGQCNSIMWLKRLPEYDQPLGKPLGPAEKEGYIYTREFEHVRVKLDIKEQKADLIWSGDKNEEL